MKVESTWIGKVVVARLVGSIDTLDSEGMGDALAEIAQKRPTGLILDFSEVDYIASMGLSMLLKLAQELRKTHSTVVIAEPTPAVKNVLDTVHMGAAITIVGSVGAALGVVGSRAAAVAIPV